MPLIYFNQGPCDLQSRNITQGELDRGSIICQGTVYVLDKALNVNGHPVFVPAAIVAAAAKQRRAFEQTHVAAAWHVLTHALAHIAPRETRRQQAAVARLRRIAR